MYKLTINDRVFEGQLGAMIKLVYEQLPNFQRGVFYQIETGRCSMQSFHFDGEYVKIEELQ